MGIFLGPAIGGLLLAATGTDVVFAATAGVFLVSVKLIMMSHRNSVAAREMRDQLDSIQQAIMRLEGVKRNSA